MKGLATFVNLVDSLNEHIGRAVSWMTLLMVIITFVVVVLRYVYAIGWVWLQESYVWLHGIVFMLGAGYTLLHNGHVRVDIFYRPNSARYKAWIDLCGALVLLLPLVIVVFLVSFDYVAASWARLEESREAGGLPGLFLLKSVILVFCALIGLQGLSLACRSFLVLTGHPEFKPEDEETEPI
ncbi:TRAP transporter small permease subunit [Pelagibius sp.]|uniref:TRAP transporter small permease subunit n=1 Tax=Pelagibius sp. TaxID=1931238 RepID=UPI003B50AF71